MEWFEQVYPLPLNKNKSVAKSDQNPCNFDKNTHNFLYRENDRSIGA